MSHGVFDIIAEDEEVEHITEEMHPAPVQELVGNEGQNGGRPAPIRRQYSLAGENQRHDPIAVDRSQILARAAARLLDEDKTAKKDYAPGNPRVGEEDPGIAVEEGKEGHNLITGPASARVQNLNRTVAGTTPAYGPRPALCRAALYRCLL